MHERRSLGVLFLVLVINVLGIGLMLPVVPMLVTELAGGEIASAATVYGWLIALYSLMQFTFGPTLGALSDRFGRRPVILTSLAGLGLDYLLLALAPNLWILAAARMIGGMMGASLATANAYVADITPPERRAQNFGILGVAFGIGFVAGPAIGGLLAAYGSRVPFYAAAAACVVAFGLAFLFLPESLKPENRRHFSLREANPFGAFRMLRRHRAVVAILAIFALAQLAERMLEATWVLFTAHEFGWGAGAVGLSLAFVGVLFVVSQGVLVRLVVPKVGEAPVATVGLAVGALSFLAFAFSYTPAMLLAVLVPYVLVWGMVGPALQAMITRSVGADQQGTLQGVVSSTQTATGVIAPPVGGALFGAFIGPSAPVELPRAAVIAGAFVFLAAFLIWRRARRRLAPAG